MPQIKDVRVSTPLTNFSLGFANQDFVGETIFPVVERNNRTGFYWIYGKEVFTPESDRRAPGTRANEVDHDYTRADYVAEEHALIEGIPWEVRDEAAAAGGALDPYQDATDITTQKIALGREIEIANLLRNTATYATGNSTTLAGTAQLNDYTNSDPFGVFRTAREAVRAKIGRRPNLAIVPPAVLETLEGHPKLLDRADKEKLGTVDNAAIAKLMRVDRVLSPEGIYNSANAGQTVSLADIWGKDIIFGYVTPRPRLREITLGITIRVRYGRFAAQVRSWTEADRKADFVESSYTEARKVTAPEAGYVVKAAIA